MNNQNQDFGKRVRKELLERGKQQKWLVSELNKYYPEIYASATSVSKVCRGDIKSGRLVEAIKVVLELDDAPNKNIIHLGRYACAKEAVPDLDRLLNECICVFRRYDVAKEQIEPVMRVLGECVAAQKCGYELDFGEKEES